MHLGLEILAAAVSLRRPEYALWICTSMLVTLIHEDTDKVIKLAHFLVKEYLVLKNQRWKTIKEAHGIDFRMR